MSFKKEPMKGSAKNIILNKLDSMTHEMGLRESLKFNETFNFEEARSCFAYEKSHYMNGKKSFLRDYLILLIDTCKHSSQNQSKNVKMILFDLKVDKIAMVYKLPLASILANDSNGLSLPKIQILNDNIHFFVWNSSGLWVFDIFRKHPIVNILVEPNSQEDSLPKQLINIQFSFDINKMVLGFSNGDLILYDFVFAFNDLYGVICVKEFHKRLEFNLNSVCQNYLDKDQDKGEYKGNLSSQRILDFKFTNYHSPHHILNIISDSVILFVDIDPETSSVKIINIKSHNLKCKGLPVKTMVLENPLRTNLDLLYIFGQTVHHENILYKQEDDFIVFNSNQTLQLNMKQDQSKRIEFEGLEEFEGPVLVFKEIDHSGNVSQAGLFRLGN